MNASRRGSIAEACVGFYISLLVTALGAFRSIDVFDEGVILVGADRVLHGELPFRDFYALYPPGQYVTVAVLFKLFGTSALTLRAWCVVVRAAIALLCYLLARRISGRLPALFATGAVVLWLESCGYYGYPVFPALALALFALSLLATALHEAWEGRPPGRLRVAAAGAAVGASALFRHDLGFYALIAAAVLVIVLAWRREGTETRLSASLRAWPFCAGLAVTFGIPAGVLVAIAPVKHLVFELFTYPATGYARMRGNPYPPFLGHPFGWEMLEHPTRIVTTFASMAYFAPAAFCLAAVAYVTIRRARGRLLRLDPAGCTLLAMSLFCALSINLARVRPDGIHITASVLLSFVVAAALAKLAWDARGRWFRAVAAVVVVTSMLMLQPAVDYLFAPSLDQVRRVLGGEPDPERLSHLSLGAPWSDAARYLRSVVPEEGRIFVGCGRHDRIFSNAPILYFMADRLPSTRYHMLDPGVATTLEAQEEIVLSLVRHRVEYVITTPAYEGRMEDNQSAVSSGVTHLDDYLNANYVVVRDFGRYLTVRRRSTKWETSGAW